MPKTTNERVHRLAAKPRLGRVLRIEDLDPEYFDDRPAPRVEQLHYDYIPAHVDDLIALAEQGVCYVG